MKNATDHRLLAQVPEMLNRAVAFHQRGDLARAKALYEEVLEIQPEQFDALHLLGVVAAQSRNPQRALELIGKAIEIRPNDALAHGNKGAALSALKQFEAALASFNQAIAIKSDYAEAHSNCGNVLRELGRLDESLAHYDQAIEIMPDFAEAYSNRGNLHRELGRLDLALADHDRAIALKPGYAEAHLNKSLALLSGGDLARGLPLYEWRWRSANSLVDEVRRRFSQPLWLGRECIAGKSILLYSEQGLGDTLQFCRYVKLAADLGARVILEVQEPLVELLAQLAGVSILIAKGSALPQFDYQCPLMSLPLAFNTELDTIPFADGYLGSDVSKVEQWRTRLGPPTSPRIGLVWSGKPSHMNDRNRSISLSDMLQHLPAGFQYVCLQTQIREGDLPILQSNPTILNYHEDMGFAATAALCECLDLVISVDTSVAHLSAALGRRTWVLLPSNADWRWFMARDDSPWYRAVTLYRQEHYGDWKGVLERVSTHLRRTFNDVGLEL